MLVGVWFVGVWFVGAAISGRTSAGVDEVSSADRPGRLRGQAPAPPTVRRWSSPSAAPGSRLQATGVPQPDSSSAPPRPGRSGSCRRDPAPGQSRPDHCARRSNGYPQILCPSIHAHVCSIQLESADEVPQGHSARRRTERKRGWGPWQQTSTTAMSRARSGASLLSWSTCWTSSLMLPRRTLWMVLVLVSVLVRRHAGR